MVQEIEHVPPNDVLASDPGTCYGWRTDKVVQRFRSHSEAGESDRAYYRSLSPQEQLDLLLELVARGQSDETEQGLARVCRVTQLHPG
jgi:hypothetical protein